MDVVFEADELTKRFGEITALDDVSVAFPRHSVIGLIGRNGSGKTTLLNHVVGLVLPSAGRATTLGRSSAQLGAGELSRMGFVPQETRFLEWMSVGEHIDYVAGFYPRWDREREARLREDLELDGDRLVGALSPGNVQKLALVLAGLCLQRGFGVTAFRETPFRPVSPIPGAYSLGQSKRYELEKMARRRPVLKAGWRLSSIAGLKSWLRRAYWENARGFSWKTTLSPFRVVGPLAVVMTIHVLFAEQGLGFRSSLAQKLYHSILRPPHIPPPADDMPYLIIPLFIAAIGATLAITRPAPLGARLLYPLSRTLWGRVVFRANLLETTSFVLTTGGAFLALALIAAAYGNYPLRIDYVPALLRALVATAALIPVFQWMRLRVLQRESRRSPGAAVLYTFVLLLAVLAVAIWCTQFQLLALPALAELLILGLLLVASQGIYRHRIERHFRVGDLN